MAYFKLELTGESESLDRIASAALSEAAEILREQDGDELRAGIDATTLYFRPLARFKGEFTWTPDAPL